MRAVDHKYRWGNMPAIDILNHAAGWDEAMYTNCDVAFVGKHINHSLCTFSINCKQLQGISGTSYKQLMGSRTTSLDS
jgi:hypothetical protein